MKSFLLILFFGISAPLTLFAQAQKTYQLQEIPLEVFRFKYSTSFNTTNYTNFSITKDSTHFEIYSNDYKKIKYKKISVTTTQSDWQALITTFNFLKFEQVQRRKPLVNHLSGNFIQKFVAETTIMAIKRLL